MKTFTPAAGDIKRAWHLIDAKDQILGRVASRVATLIMGKHKPDFAAHADTGDIVVIINAEQIRTTGNKETQKVYFRHSGYPGGDRTTTMAQLRASKPEQVLIRSVSGMLPDNRLKAVRLKRLHVIVGETHPYGQHFK
jgi:large subunit ribosomal protein L13